MNHIIEQIKGKIIVSCQAYPGEPMRDPDTMARVAQAVVEGGAAAVRAQGLEDIRAIVKAVDVPVIGLWKDGHSGVYITPTLEHALACAEAGAHVVAIDATRRPRPDGRSFAQVVAGLKEAYPDVLVMADCGSLDDALMAEEAGCDITGTTLAGYSGERPKTDGPDWEFIDQVVANCSRPIVVEGRLHTPEQAARALERGAWSACVGTAITHPTSITKWFIEATK